MIYGNWMEYIKDDVLLREVIMPGAHNTGSYGMGAMACCQDGTLYEQFMYGIRHYCVRLNTDKKGNIVLAHGITKGDLFENALKDIGRALDEHPNEFIVFDVREYYPQKFGPITLHFKADAAKLDELFAKYLNPEKYALTDFDIRTLTMGDIRKSGKRFILLNYQGEYKYSTDCPHIFPWGKGMYGLKAKAFAKEILTAFDRFETEGLFWFQTQQTPNLGTEVGVKTPRKLDMTVRPYFSGIIDAIRKNPKYLAKANIISGDFMTQDYMKVSEILKLNIDKKTVISGKEEEYLEGLKG